MGCTGPGGPRRGSNFQAQNFESTEIFAKLKRGSTVEKDQVGKEVIENVMTYYAPRIPHINESWKSIH